MIRDGCPEPEELIALLPDRAPGDAHLLEHVQACADCQEALESLRQAFTALPLAADPQAVARIESAVLQQIREEPAAHEWSLWLVGKLYLVTVALMLTTVMVSGHLLHPGTAFEWVHLPRVLVLLVPLFLLLTFWMHRGRFWGLAASLFATVALTLPFATGIDHGIAREKMCLLFIPLGIPLPTIALSWALFRRIHEPIAAAVFAATVFTGGLVLQTLICSLNGRSHVMVLHLLPLVLSALLGALLKGLWSRGRRAMET